MNTVNITYYKNRKLYSTDAKRYVTLTECCQLLEKGYVVKFIDHVTGEDVTSKCVKELIKRSNIDVNKLLKLIRKELSYETNRNTNPSAIRCPA